eukprot:TRINITY_DN43_c0_g1_i2.p1 TRINITY_DN43_c0_g1~~TRINITY_DN43_c0_g1_i2.p1  ORF type:complete len:134 (+),score=7.42 TRINITY_DN43_c0_g1_i2:62-463(+)
MTIPTYLPRFAVLLLGILLGLFASSDAYVVCSAYLGLISYCPDGSYCCGYNLCCRIDSTDSGKEKSKANVGAIVGGVVAAYLCIVCGTMIGLLLCYRQRAARQEAIRKSNEADAATAPATGIPVAQMPVGENP